MPVSRMALVIVPVPGPISSTGKPDLMSTTLAMRFAMGALVGHTEPTVCGFFNHAFKKPIPSLNVPLMRGAGLFVMQRSFVSVGHQMREKPDLDKSNAKIAELFGEPVKELFHTGEKAAGLRAVFLR